MIELESNEFLFLKKIDESLRLVNYKGVAIEDVFDKFGGYNRDLFKVSNAKEILAKLLAKEIISLSPDAAKFKLTDYGRRLLSKKLKEEED